MLFRSRSGHVSEVVGVSELAAALVVAAVLGIPDLMVLGFELLLLSQPS